MSQPGAETAQTAIKLQHPGSSQGDVPKMSEQIHRQQSFVKILAECRHRESRQASLCKYLPERGVERIGGWLMRFGMTDSSHGLKL
jgi:hypothetical protein